MKRYEAQLKGLRNLLLTSYGIGLGVGIVSALLIGDKNLNNFLFNIIFLGFLVGSIVTVIKLNTKSSNIAEIAIFKLIKGLIIFPHLSFSSGLMGLQFAKIVLSIFTISLVGLFEIAATPVTIVYIVIMYFIEKKKEISESLADTLDKIVPVLGSIIFIIVAFTFLNALPSKTKSVENVSSENIIETKTKLDNQFEEKNTEILSNTKEDEIVILSDISLIENKIEAINADTDISVKIESSNLIQEGEDKFFEYIVNVNINGKDNYISHKDRVIFERPDIIYSDTPYRLLDMDKDGSLEIIINLSDSENRDASGYFPGELIILSVKEGAIVEMTSESRFALSHEGVAISDGTLYARVIWDGGPTDGSGNPSYIFYSLENDQIKYNYSGSEEPSDADWF